MFIEKLKAEENSLYQTGNNLDNNLHVNKNHLVYLQRNEESPPEQEFVYEYFLLFGIAEIAIP